MHIKHVRRASISDMYVHMPSTVRVVIHVHDQSCTYSSVRSRGLDSRSVLRHLRELSGACTMATRNTKRARIAESINASATMTGSDGVTRDRAAWKRMRDACVLNSTREKKISEQEKKVQTLMTELKVKKRERKRRYKAVVNRAGRMAVTDLLEIALMKAWILAKEIKDPAHRVEDEAWVPPNPVVAIEKVWQWAREQKDPETIRLLADMRDHPLAGMSADS